MVCCMINYPHYTRFLAMNEAYRLSQTFATLCENTNAIMTRAVMARETLNHCAQVENFKW